MPLKPLPGAKQGPNAYGRESGVTRLSCLQHCKRGFIDGWTEENNLRWRRTYAPPILKKLKAALQKVVDFFEYLTDVINRIAAMGAKATADTCRDLLPDKWEKKQ